MVGQVGQPQNMERRAEKNREQSSESQINSARGIEQVVDCFVKERPERVVQARNGDKRHAPPNTFRQQIKRQNKKLKEVQENTQPRKAVIKNVGYQEFCSSRWRREGNWQVGHVDRSLTNRFTLFHCHLDWVLFVEICATHERRDVYANACMLQAQFLKQIQKGQLR